MIRRPSIIIRWRIRDETQHYLHESLTAAIGKGGVLKLHTIAYSASLFLQRPKVMQVTSRGVFSIIMTMANNLRRNATCENANDWYLPTLTLHTHHRNGEFSLAEPVSLCTHRNEELMMEPHNRLLEQPTKSSNNEECITSRFVEYRLHFRWWVGNDTCCGATTF